MKPSFALNLNHDGISLLHRANGGWHLVGDVPVDDPELTQKLRYLRRTAAELAGGRLATKLVVPNSQILYRRVETGTGDEDARMAAIKAALDGATPYALNDLQIDWCDVGGGTALVAAVAKETLVEAEAFANEHRFSPVSFVAIADEGDFQGEVFFGPTTIAGNLMATGETVVRDEAPIRIIGGDPIAEREAETESFLEPAAQQALEAALKDGDAPVQAKGKAASGPDVALAASETGSAEMTEDHSDPEPAESDLALKVRPSGVVSEKTSDELPDLTVQISAASSASNANDPLPSLAFTTRRDGAESRSETLRLDKVMSRIALRDAPETNSGPKIGGVRRDAEVTPLPVTASGTVDLEAGPNLTIPKAPPLNGSARSMSGLETAVQKVHAEAVKPANAPGTAPTSTKRNDETTTVFGARNSQPVGGAPRFLGLMLVLALLAALIAAGLLSSYFLPQAASSWLYGPSTPGTTDEKLTVSALAPEATVATAPNGAVPEAKVELSALPEPELLKDILNRPTEEETAEISADEAVPMPNLAPADNVILNSSLGIWSQDPVQPPESESETLDSLYVASIDPVVVSRDAIALPDRLALATDARLSVPSGPAPAGATYDRDENGFVRATAKGAMTPEGAFVRLGRPPVVTAARPAVAAPVSPELQRLAAILPRPRAGGLVEKNEKARLGGRTSTQLAGLRPVSRPDSPQDISEAVKPIGGSKLALALSPRPGGRPANFAKLVAIARAVAPEEQPEEQPQEAVASVASAVAEPIIPKVPTRASVAKAATIENAINLSKLNLIGVFGSSADRRALVRLGNGRYVKVRVGDKLDGGQVAAIDSEQVLWTKSGKTYRLSLPKG